MRFAPFAVAGAAVLFLAPLSSRGQGAGDFNPDSIRRIVEFLSADSLQGRFAGTKTNEQAARYIAREFASLGLKPLPGFPDYLIKFTSTAAFGDITVNVEAYNVAAMLPGSTRAAEYVLYSAHLDHVGTLSTNLLRKFVDDAHQRPGDTIYNGANDDASGVSAVITLAKYFAKKKRNARTLVFAAFNAEELGLLGSADFAQRFPVESVAAVVNIEMIGRKYFPGGKPYITGESLSDFRVLLNRRLSLKDKQPYGTEFFQADPFIAQGLFRRSDNWPFFRHFVAAHSIMTTSPEDEYYHSLGDEWQTLDYHLMAKTIKAIALGTAGLVSGEDRPRLHDK